MTALVDAHLHVWDPDARHHDWLDELPALHRRYTPDDLDYGCHDVTAAVFVQADCRASEALEEVRWVQELALAHPFLCAVIAHAPVHLGAAAEPRLSTVAAEPLVVGVRELLQALPPASVVDPNLIAGVRLLPEWNLTFDLCVTHEQLPAVAELVAACPDTSFVLDHLGKPPVASGRLDPWRADIERVASFANVSCKLSGLITEAAPNWGERDLRPYLEHALQTFGPQRCMVGSDWPLLTLRATAERWFALVLETVDSLAGVDREQVLSGTATAVYGLPVPAAPA